MKILKATALNNSNTKRLDVRNPTFKKITRLKYIIHLLHNSEENMILRE